MLTQIYLLFSYINTNFLQLAFISLVDLVLLSGLFVTSYLAFISGNTRERLVYLACFILASACIGFTVNMDVYVFFLLSAELMAALLIFLVLLNPRTPEVNGKQHSMYFYLYISVGYLLYLWVIAASFTQVPGAISNTYLYALDNTSHDLSPVFWYFVQFATLIGILISLLLGVFSFFFIGYYFTLKGNKIGESLSRQLSFKKRQNFVKQRRFKTQIGIFRSKIKPIKVAQGELAATVGTPNEKISAATTSITRVKPDVPKRKLHNTLRFKWHLTCKSFSGSAN